MQTKIDPKILDRITKMLALAQDGGATEAEAEVAMTKAQEMMAAHNLTMATLTASGGRSEGRVKERTDKKLMYVWKRELLDKIAEVNFCHLFIVMGRTRGDERIATGYEIIGRQSNVVAVHQMFEYLTTTIEKLLVAEIGNSPQDRYSRWGHNFRLGCSTRLQERLQERFDKMLEDQERAAREERARSQHPAAATSNALVVVMRDYRQDEIDLNNDLRRGVEPGTTKREREEREARDAENRARWAKEKAERVAQAEADGATEQELEVMRTYGWSLNYAREAIKLWAKPDRPETEKQRKAREAREARADARWEARRDRETARERTEAYRRGTARADEVGLDDQITNDGRKLNNG